MKNYLLLKTKGFIYTNTIQVGNLL